MMAGGKAGACTADAGGIPKWGNDEWKIPAAIFGRRKPALGMLMIPKTLCYVRMLAVVAFC